MRSARSVLLVLAVATAMTVGATVASNAAPAEITASSEPPAEVSTNPEGAHIELRRRDSWVEVTSTGGSAITCRRRWIPSGAFKLVKSRFGDYRQLPLGEPRPGPDYSVYQVWCGSDYLGAVWLRPQSFGVDPVDIAQRLALDIPYPKATVAANPAGRGLTGLESWFWVDGYTGAPILNTVSRFGLTVDVEATPTAVSWDFGDGTVVKGLGLGSAPPAPSTVVHTFETRGRPAFAVRALIRLSVRWRLNGAAWQSIDPVTRTGVLSYPVVESRAALVP